MGGLGVEGVDGSWVIINILIVGCILNGVIVECVIKSLFM